MAGRHRAGALAALVALAFAPPARARDQAPEWLQALASQSVDSLARDADAVVLLDESRYEIAPDGRQKVVTRYAVRILLASGRDAAVAADYYQAKEGDGGQQRAWLIRPSGSVTEYKGADVLDRSLNSAINDAGRQRLVDASADAGPGSVFGFESVRERRTVFRQFFFYFESARPMLTTRMVLQAPPGWKVRWRATGRDSVVPRQDGDLWTWERLRVPAVRDEPFAVPGPCYITMVKVVVDPPDGRTPEGPPAAATWPDLSRWVADIAAPSGALTPELAAAARNAVRAAGSCLDSVRAIGTLAQAVRYESIELGIERGGGFRPRPAAEVMGRGYGDCKDKANLMCTMLGAIGIPASLALVEYQDFGAVDEAWPSFQFDHCIVAVRSPRLGACPTTVNDPKLGPLTFFDPTDPTTAFGDLPAREQGQPALIVAAAGAGIVRMPALPVHRAVNERRVRLEVGADGAVHGTLEDRTTGQLAASQRQSVREGATPRVQALERWLAAGTSGIELREHSDSEEPPGTHRLALAFDAPRYGQRMGGTLLMVRPVVAGRFREPATPEHDRRADVALTVHAVHETVLVVPPAGWTVDELPPPLRVERPFGSYELRCAAGVEGVVCTRTVEIRERRLPASQYDAVRAFYAAARRAEETPIVFARP